MNVYNAWTNLTGIPNCFNGPYDDESCHGVNAIALLAFQTCDFFHRITPCQIHIEKKNCELSDGRVTIGTLPPFERLDVLTSRIAEYLTGKEEYPLY